MLTVHPVPSTLSGIPVADRIAAEVAGQLEVAEYCTRHGMHLLALKALLKAWSLQ